MTATKIAVNLRITLTEDELRELTGDYGIERRYVREAVRQHILTLVQTSPMGEYWTTELAS